MAYPPFEEYQEALRASPHETFTDPVLASGQVVRKRSGEPLALSGNFALTYQVVSANRRYAVRCFHKFGDALPQRYEAITRRLAEMPSPYFVDCEFQPGGIRTESGWYPLVRMDWVDGPTLGAFVADHYADAVTMQQLRASLRVLARQLAALGIAHGDIQPGNIVVRGATDVSLIDYDGMFVPELATLGSIELGQRNFQHPGRRWRHYHARLDGFSFAVMDVALGALAYRPELWNDARCDESAFVFRAEDFIEPYASAAFGWVSEIPGLEVKAQYLAAICQSPFDETPGIEDFLAGRAIPVPRVRVSSQPFRTHRPRYLPAFPVVDAANFAQACAHVGDRAELIGRIRRSRVAGVTLADGGWIRVEFGAFPDDMAALHMHTTAAATEAAIDGLRQGEWISAIGLVEPPHVERIEDHTCKVVTLQIDHHSQVTKLSASEARHRLAASARGVSPGDDHAPERVGTDPAFPESPPCRRSSSMTLVCRSATRLPQSSRLPLRVHSKRCPITSFGLALRRSAPRQGPLGLGARHAWRRCCCSCSPCVTHAAPPHPLSRLLLARRTVDRRPSLAAMPRPTSPTAAAAPWTAPRPRAVMTPQYKRGSRPRSSTRRRLCAAHGPCDRGTCRSRPASASCRSCGVPAWSSRRWTGARSTTSALLRSVLRTSQTSVSASY